MNLRRMTTSTPGAAATTEIAAPVHTSGKAGCCSAPQPSALAAGGLYSNTRPPKQVGTVKTPRVTHPRISAHQHRHDWTTRSARAERGSVPYRTGKSGVHATTDTTGDGGHEPATSMGNPRSDRKHELLQGGQRVPKCQSMNYDTTATGTQQQQHTLARLHV